MSSILNRWKRYWQQIIQSTDNLLQAENQYDKRLLSTLTVALLIATMIISPIWIASNPNFKATLPISVGLVFALLIAWYLIRTQHARIGVYILVGLLPCTVAAVIVTAPGPIMDRMLSLNFLVVSILLASILLDLRATVILAIVNILGTSAFFFVPGVPFAITYPYVVYQALMSALLIVTTIMRTVYLRRLHQSERRYRSLFEQSNDAVFMLNLDGIHLEVNQRAADMLGYTPEELAGLSFKKIVSLSDHSSSEAVLDNLKTNTFLPPYERLFRKKDGTELSVEINAELVRDTDGQPIHIQSIVRDISERKRAQERAQAQALEQERMQLLTNFVTNASHEIRTPLALINTNMYLMTKATDEQQRQRYAQQGERSVMQLRKLVDMILSMTKLDSSVPLAYKPSDINSLISQAMSHISQRLKDMTHTIVFDPDISLPQLQLDEHWISEAVINLLDNAIRFTPEGGTISARTYRQDSYVVIEVKDTGIGIGEDALAHIFERFWRLDEVHTTPGFGLGLPIAEAVVKRHSGKIEVESALGSGSIFKVSLPIAEAS
ncbi:MAG: PAS domain S-box protein [Anaerolineaceae bacterium]|nr:PAS domain S-box protein [Anaerolineaceae bacterium]